MQTIPVTGRPGTYEGVAPEASASGVAWPAIIGGAFAAAALSLILLALGSGFGLASVSPWSNSGASLTTFTAATAVWLIIVQWLASAVGGYLTGRLRTKWAGLHTHEVFFRDTANGFLSWAVASVVVAAFLASAAASVVSGGVQVAAGVASGAARGVSQGATQAAGQSGGTLADATGYLVDSLYRSEHPPASATNQEVASETTRILVRGLQNGDVPAADKTYLAQLVAARTGLSQADAGKRVDDVIAQAKAAETKLRQAADAARKAGSYLAIFTGLSMLIGAFIACTAAALGGRERDEHS
ncbi:MAG TPA: hypothetical protein VFW75_04630 [Acetobacteraceae bacterium]|nr:hypothetical protein [Acetobacteraceae bacterium]